MGKNRCPECKNILYSISGLYYDKDGIRPAKYCSKCYKLFESHAFGLVEKKHKTFVSKHIAELEAEIEGYKVSERRKDEQIEVYGNETRRYARLMGEVVEERDQLKAAIATPELYVGVVAKALAEEMESAIAENLKLRAMLERLVAAAEEALTVTVSGWQANKLKSAIAEAKEVLL